MAVAVDALPIEVPGQIQNGIYSMQGPRGHKVVKVKTVQDGPLAGKRIVYVLTGPDNTFNYSGVAFLNTVYENVEEEYEEETTDEQGARVVEKKKRTVQRPKDVLKVWKAQQGTELHKVVAAWYRIVTVGIEGYSWTHEGYCIRCNRLLTTPESIAAGIGPICAKGGMD